MADQDQLAGQFILTGSQNFLLLEKMEQSLAGRSAIMHLLPLEMDELQKAKNMLYSIEEMLVKGFYPRLYEQTVEPLDWYPNYIRTYIERDVRQIKNVHDLDTFQLFLKMCASRGGQLLDLTSLGNNCGISHNTAKAWLNILKASFILFFLRPHYNNFNKRVVKTPKLYFYDTGLLCSLLGIHTPDQLHTHYLRGGIFESYVVSECKKQIYHKLSNSSLYFWRDHQGHEVDCLVEKGINLTPIEIKSSKTISPSFFENLNYWQKLDDQNSKGAFLIYGGDTSQKRSSARVLSWKEIDLDNII